MPTILSLSRGRSSPSLSSSSSTLDLKSTILFDGWSHNFRANYSSPCCLGHSTNVIGSIITLPRRRLCLLCSYRHIRNIAIIPNCPPVVCGHLIIVVRLPQTCVYMPHMPQICVYLPQTCVYYMPHMPHSDLIIRLSSRSWAHHRCFTLPPSVTPLLFLSLSPQLLEPPRIGAHLGEFTVFPPFFPPFENFCKLAQTMKAGSLRA